MITLNAIVKNEAETLPTMLRSVKDWVDEIVIVDTGSTEATVDIAKNFGAQVEHFEWCDNFAAARNHALSFVRTPWTLWADADDLILNPECLPAITEQARKKRINALWSTYLQDSQTQQRRLQLFKTKDYQWEGFVHESPIPRRHSTALSDFTGLRVLHRKPAGRTLDSALRYLHILLEKDPNNFLGIAESYRFLAVHPESPEKQGEYKTLAEKYYWEAANYPNVNEPTRYMALFQCAKLQLEMAEESKNIEWFKLAYKTAQLCYKINPHRAEGVVICGQIAQAMGNPEHAKEFYTEALRLPKPDDIGVIYDLYYKDIPQRLLNNLNGLV